MSPRLSIAEMSGLVSMFLVLSARTLSLMTLRSQRAQSPRHMRYIQVASSIPSASLSGRGNRTSFPLLANAHNRYRSDQESNPIRSGPTFENVHGQRAGLSRRIGANFAAKEKKRSPRLHKRMMMAQALQT